MGRKRGRAQISMEFLTVITFAFLLIVPLILFFFSESQTAVDDVGTAQVSQILRKIVSTAETAYAFGEPTSLTLRVYMPQGVENITISGRQILFTIRNSNGELSVSEVAPMNLTGSLTTHAGIHNIRVSAANNSIVLSEFEVS